MHFRHHSIKITFLLFDALKNLIGYYCNIGGILVFKSIIFQCLIIEANNNKCPTSRSAEMQRLSTSVARIDRRSSPNAETSSTIKKAAIASRWSPPKRTDFS